MANGSITAELFEQQLSTVFMAAAMGHKELDPRPHREILYHGVKVGDLDFLALFEQCLADSYGLIAAPKYFSRSTKAYNLGRYFDHVLRNVPSGAWGECGVFAGFSSLLLCRIALAYNPHFTGNGYHLIDSFEGLSAATLPDKTALIDPNTGEITSGYVADTFAKSLEVVQQNVGTHFPDVTYHKGWIPPVLSEIPEQSWSFVHIDVDLYEPTKACLEYFYPRMVKGGIILTDDYVTPKFPGCRKAWNEFCVARNLSFAVLDGGQAVLEKMTA